MLFVRSIINMYTTRIKYKDCHRGTSCFKIEHSIRCYSLQIFSSYFNAITSQAVETSKNCDVFDVFHNINKIIYVIMKTFLDVFIE